MERLHNGYLGEVEFGSIDPTMSVRDLSLIRPGEA